MIVACVPSPLKIFSGTQEQEFPKFLAQVSLLTNTKKNLFCFVVLIYWHFYIEVSKDHSRGAHYITLSDRVILMLCILKWDCPSNLLEGGMKLLMVTSMSITLYHSTGTCSRNLMSEVMNIIFDRYIMKVSL